MLDVFEFKLRMRLTVARAGEPETGGVGEHNAHLFSARAELAHA